MSLYALLQDVVAKLESERVHPTASMPALVANTDVALGALGAAILAHERDAAHAAELLRGLAELAAEGAEL